jgi:hypothetical protein
LYKPQIIDEDDCGAIGGMKIGTYWIGGWVDPRAGLDDVKKRKFLTLPGVELRPLGCPARSQSLYGLRYHGSPTYIYIYILYICVYDDRWNVRNK